MREIRCESINYELFLSRLGKCLGIRREKASMQKSGDCDSEKDAKGRLIETRCDMVLAIGSDVSG